MKKVVAKNKTYFEHMADFGEQIADKIEVKYPDFDQKFVKDVELDKKVVNQIVMQHLFKEGLKETASTFLAESNDS